MRRTVRIGRAPWPGGRRLLRVSVAALAAASVLGAFSPATASASPQALNWTQQHPATSPPGLIHSPMAYDAATGDVVLFRGFAVRGTVNRYPRNTWTWG